jgi:hypothetical protein
MSNYDIYTKFYLPEIRFFPGFSPFIYQTHGKGMLNNSFTVQRRFVNPAAIALYPVLRQYHLHLAFGFASFRVIAGDSLSLA